MHCGGKATFSPRQSLLESVKTTASFIDQLSVAMLAMLSSSIKVLVPEADDEVVLVAAYLAR
jgi:hypothetical protein